MDGGLLICELLYFFNNLSTFLKGFHIQRNQTVMALRQSLIESLLHTLVAHYRSHLEQSAQHNHVEHLTILHLSSLIHGIDFENSNVFTSWLLDDTEAIIDKYATRLDLGFKLLK